MGKTYQSLANTDKKQVAVGRIKSFGRPDVAPKP